MSSTITSLNGFYVQNANEPWSITSTSDPSTFRFELRPNDPLWEGSHRTEIRDLTMHPSGTPINVSYNLPLEPGQANTASWLVLGQFHNNDTQTPAPFAVMLYGEHMAIVARYQLPGQSDQTYMRLWEDPNPIQRGHAYAMNIDVNFDNSGNGYLHVWRDGMEIVDYQGPIGYGQQVYWKEGIYSSDSPQTIAVIFSNLTISTPSSRIILTTQSVPLGAQTRKNRAGPPTQ